MIINSPESIVFCLCVFSVLSSDLNRETLKQYPVDIPKIFSESSDISLAITSCNRKSQLAITINSFFHYNSYPLRKLVIVEDCNPGSTDAIWSLLPPSASQYPQYFEVITNIDKKGQIPSIDIAYSRIETKYVYHLEDDWAQLRGYGMLERLKSVLEDAQAKNKKISQVVQTFPLWDWNHQLLKADWTKNKIQYHQIESYGKQWLYHFSFNPHLLNLDIYRKQLNNSLISSIALRYHCIQDASELMEDGGCVEKQLGNHLHKLEYRQAFVNLGEEPFYMHIGFPQFRQAPIPLTQLQQQLIDSPKEDDKNKEQVKGGLRNYQTGMVISLVLFLIFGIVKLCEEVCVQKVVRVQKIIYEESPQNLPVMRDSDN